MSKFGPDFFMACSRSELRFMTVTRSLTASHPAITARAVAPAPITKTFPLASRPLNLSASVNPSTSVLVKLHKPSTLLNVFPL